MRLGIALAHGNPVIAVQPDVVAADSRITVTGTEMEPGEEFAITLEGPGISIPLGKAKASGSGEEGGFVATFTIPGNATPGSY
ncbi:MAG: hypothetical protein IE924_13830, partial [Microbacterium sp.]|uniref:hypothetical protein n=1 Tax=Microbacterium sp. TaxID=51671 RepID=UPI0019C4D739